MLYREWWEMISNKCLVHAPGGTRLHAGFVRGEKQPKRKRIIPKNKSHQNFSWRDSESELQIWTPPRSAPGKRKPNLIYTDEVDFQFPLSASHYKEQTQTNLLSVSHPSKTPYEEERDHIVQHNRHPLYKHSVWKNLSPRAVRRHATVPFLRKKMMLKSPFWRNCSR